MEKKTEQPQEDNSQFASTSMIQESSGGSSSSMLLYGGIGIFIVIVVLMVIYILFSHTKTKLGTNMGISLNQQMQNTSPTLAPVTATNADQTLNTTDTSMQQAASQIGTDLNDLNNVNTGGDNQNNL